LASHLDQQDQQLHRDTFQFQGPAGTPKLIGAYVEFVVLSKLDWFCDSNRLGRHGTYPKRKEVILQRLCFNITTSIFSVD